MKPATPTIPLVSEAGRAARPIRALPLPCPRCCGLMLTPTCRRVRRVTDALRPLVEVTWPADREPSPSFWYGVDPETTWLTWVRHRFAEPRRHAVYLIACAQPNHWYIGLTVGLDRRMREHARAAGLLAKNKPIDTPSKRFMANHGFRQVVATCWCPDRVTATEMECEWSYTLAQTGAVVFGHGIRNACPLSAVLGDVPWWTWRNVAQVAA